MMFSRNEKGNLRFERLDFECLIADLLEGEPPKSKKDLEWMTKCLVESVMLVAWEYADDNGIEDWEDLFCPVY